MSDLFGNDPNAFPLQLDFNTPTASFTQTAILQQNNPGTPEPSTVIGLGLLLGFAVLSRRPRQV